MSLKNLLMADDKFASYVRIRKSVSAGFNPAAYTLESNNIFAQRPMRKLSSANVNPRALQEAIVVDLSVRARLAEIRVLVMRQHELMSTSIQVTKSHVLATYPDEIEDEFGKSAAHRNAAMDYFFQTGSALVLEMQSVLDRVDIYIKDIDNAGFSSRNLVQLLQIMLSRKEITEL